MAHSDAARLRGSPWALVTGHEPRASTARRAPQHWTARSPWKCQCLPCFASVPSGRPPESKASPSLASRASLHRRTGSGLSQVLSRPCPHRCRCGCLLSITSNTHQPVFTNIRPFSIPSQHSQHSHPGTPRPLSTLHPATSAPAPTINAPIGWRSSNAA